MERRSRTESVGELPEAMIHHIQSFMGGKEAAKTTLVSKSWYNAWLTRPNLVFDQRDIKGSYDSKSEILTKLLDKALPRYQDLNLKIDSFKIWMQSLGSVGYSLANEFIVEAIKMGASDISFELLFQTLQFDLPRDVLESETLVKLSVGGCKMGIVKVNCSSLKYLYLHEVYLEGDLLWDKISRCRLIEGLGLRGCKCFWGKNRMFLLNLSNKYFELHKLKKLLLEKVKICSLFFIDLLSRFPSLKDLSVHNCSGYNKVKIHSQSLEFISFVHGRTVFKAEFDVPNLCKFCFLGNDHLPCVSFPNSSNWESDVSVSCLSDLSAKWFMNLNKCLMNMRLSKVSLLLRETYLIRIDDAGNTGCLPKPVVENLTVDVPSSDCYAFFGRLLQWCRPVNVTLYWNPEYSFVDGKRGMESLEIVYQRLLHWDGVEGVIVEDFDVDISDWRTKSLLDALTSRVGRLRFRFRVRDSAA